MFKVILLVVIAVIAAVLIYAAAQPDTFQVQRSAVIQATPEKIFPFLNDFNKWQSWSPWEKKDPTMKRSFSGPASGVGAVYGWDGNSEVGQGRMTITTSTPSSKVALDLEFLKPFQITNQVEFTLQPEGNGTKVIWVMKGSSPFVAKVMRVFMDMDGMVGKDFETGLINLKAQSEK